MQAELRAALPSQVCGVRFHPRALKIIHETIEQYDDSSRTEVIRQVCVRLNWVNSLGKPRLTTAAATLLQFHRRGWIALPPARTRQPGNRCIQALPDDVVLPDTPLEIPLSDVRGLTLQAVTSKADSRLWNGLIARFHYQGYAIAFGAQQRYLLQSEQGVLGALGFSAAARHLRDRDQWIGWDQAQRRDRRHLVVNNSRFLILPWVRIRNLASRVLAMAAKQLPVDFQQRYGYAPLLLETFVEQPRFAGTCYRAANWIQVGQTTGRGRTDLRSAQQRQLEAPPLPIKSIWLYPLRPIPEIRDTLGCCAPTSDGRAA